MSVSLEEIASRWLAAWPGSVAGIATIFFLPVGAPTPRRVEAAVQVFDDGSHSLEVICRTPARGSPSFLMVLDLSGDYVGPGVYEGGVDDVMVGLGVAGNGSSSWTAGGSTRTILTTYGADAATTVGTLTSTGLLTGPVFGPPDCAVPACDILFAWFALEAG